MIFDHFELQKGVKLIGYSDLVVQALGILVYGIVLVSQSEDFYKTLSNSDFSWNVSVCLNTSWNESVKNMSSCFFWPDIAGVSTSASGLLIHLIEIGIAFGLIKGAKMRNHQKCNTWVVQTTILTILESGVLAGYLSLDTNKLLMLYAIPNIIYKFGSCGIVKSFVTEVKKMNHQKQEPLSNESDDDHQTENERVPILT